MSARSRDLSNSIALDTATGYNPVDRLGARGLAPLEERRCA